VIRISPVAWHQGSFILPVACYDHRGRQALGGLLTITCHGQWYRARFLRAETLVWVRFDLSSIFELGSEQVRIMAGVDFVGMFSKITVLIPAKKEQTAWNWALNFGRQVSEKITLSGEASFA